MMRIRVVVVSWNSGALLERCITHLERTRWTDGSLDLMVVDNGSTDGSIDDWAQRHPTVELRQTGSNLGFGAAANVGLVDLDGVDAAALINPDAFVDPGWLAPLVAVLEADAGVGAACPKIVFAETDEHGRTVINNVGNVLGPTWELHDRGYGEPDIGQYDRPEEVWGWCGGAVLLRRDYLASVGLFDETLFLYAEDVDLSWRGRRMGWRYRYEPKSLVRHVHRASSGGQRTPLVDYLNRRNRLIVVTRHGGYRGAAIAWTRAIAGLLVAAIRDGLLPAVLRRRVDLASLQRRERALVDAVRALRGHPVAPPLDGGLPGSPP